MSFTAMEVRYIVSGDAAAWLTAGPTWRHVNGKWRGEVPVWSEKLPDSAVAFWLMLARRNRPSFVMTVRNQACRRLDVNTPHLDLPDTHIQGRDDPTHPEFAKDARGLFPEIPKTGSVDGEQYAATFVAFAKYLGISRGAFEWVDMPLGGPQ